MRTAFALACVAVVAADEKKKTMLPSAATSIVGSQNDATGETCTLSYVTNLVGDDTALVGSTTISSASKNLNNGRFGLNIRAEGATDCAARYAIYAKNLDNADATQHQVLFRNAKADQNGGCNGDDNARKDLVNSNDDDGGKFVNANDNAMLKDVVTVTKKSYTAKADSNPSVLVVDWSRKLEGSATAEHNLGKIDYGKTLQVNLAWRGEDASWLSTDANNAAAWASFPVLKMVEGAAAIKLGAAVLAASAASML